MEVLDEIDGTAFPWEQIVRNAVHDLRTPLCSISFTLEVMRMSPADPQAQSQLRLMLNEKVKEMDLLLETLVIDPASFASKSGSRTNDL